jgi:hypothetical protein
VLRPVRAFAAQQGWSFEATHAVGQPGDAMVCALPSTARKIFMVRSGGVGDR